MSLHVLCDTKSNFSRWTHKIKSHYRPHDTVKFEYLNVILITLILSFEIYDSHGGRYEDGCLPGCCAVQPSRRLLTFHRCLPSPSSDQWSKQQADYIVPTTQKTAIFTLSFTCYYYLYSTILFIVSDLYTLYKFLSRQHSLRHSTLFPECYSWPQKILVYCSDL
jgi:hypothetical protein